LFVKWQWENQIFLKPVRGETSMKLTSVIATSVIAAGLLFAGSASAGKPVGITPDMSSMKLGDTEISRDQNNDATVNPAFAKTSRPCPPFCIQPIVLAPGVETLGEVEVIHYAKKMSDGDSSIVLIDSRTPDWVAKGTIPTAINLPWTEINVKKGATTDGIMKVLS
jgi:hypothetical protein